MPRTIVSLGVLAAALALPLVAGATPQQQGDRLSSASVLRTSTGALIPARPVGTLSCAEIRSSLARIDRTGYRGIEPIAEGHADHAVFAYEDALARALYRNCTAVIPTSGDNLFGFAYRGTH